MQEPDETPPKVVEKLWHGALLAQGLPDASLSCTTTHPMFWSHRATSEVELIVQFTTIEAVLSLLEQANKGSAAATSQIRIITERDTGKLTSLGNIYDVQLAPIRKFVLRVAGWGTAHVPKRRFWIQWFPWCAKAWFDQLPAKRPVEQFRPGTIQIAMANSK